MPAAPRIVVRPVLATLVLHGLMLYFLTANWAGSEVEVTRVKPAPRVINAHLVDVSDFKPKPKPKPVAKPKTRTKPKSKPRPVAKSKPKPAAKVKPAAKPKPVVKPRPKAEPRISEQELAAMARADLSRAMAEEEQVRATATAEEMAASYAALIQQTVVNYWSRPPSARNGMEALLAIQLIPTGEVVSVTVLKSSGNTAFDRSAVNAVEKAGSFPELQSLPTREFEKTFRRFRLLFRPEDLRY
ncbi:MAG: cell envelope integrity protein TolA [Gammaproteobacteria bacterium]|nr:MAG: cell envelope integrity protein TolA [Gammaproteobacteria bacterium]RLA56958.1 MAG: cell envelope integrity protein TolA [Gammaproteobacteria bacterium]